MDKWILLWTSKHYKDCLAKFRRYHIPYTGLGNKTWFGHDFRHVKTFQEQKWNCAHKEYVRAKRHRIRHAWDDQLPTNRGTRSWKRTKKRKQWM